MFTFLAAIFGAKFYSEHSTIINIIFVAIIVLIIRALFLRRRSSTVSTVDRQEMEDRERERRLAAEKERKLKEEADRKRIELETKGYTGEIHIPDHFKGCCLAYHYDDVKLTSSGFSPSRIVPKEALSLKDTGTSIEVYQGDLLLGCLPTNRLSDMVRDWDKNREPYLAYVSKCSADGNDVEIALAFYIDKLGRFISKHPGAKLYKLSGKPDEFVSPSLGDECSVDYDVEKDKYFVMLDGDIVGCLPASAVRYAKNQELDLDDLTVIIGSVDYDTDKDRDVISVYISD